MAGTIVVLCVVVVGLVVGGGMMLGQSQMGPAVICFLLAILASIFWLVRYSRLLLNLKNSLTAS